MANSSRLMVDRNGKIFMPMNVDGGNWSDSFFTSGKMATLIGMLVGAILVGMWMSDKQLGLQKTLLIIGVMFILYIELTRYVIFQEKYYYRMYIKMKQYQNPTPAVFWDIVSIRDTDDGAIMQYSDLKTAIMIRLERDTIVGRNADFREEHFDALSDMYKELNNKKLSYIQINIMEPAGKDPRMKELDELVLKPGNKKVSKLIEKITGFVKQVTRAALFETDYLLVYTRNPNQADTIIADTIDCLYPILHGAFVGFRLLDAHDILELPKEIYGVRYFDYTEATVAMFRKSGVQVGNTFNIQSVQFKNGEEIVVGNKENMLLKRLFNCINNGSIKYGEWTIRDTMNGRLSIKKSDLDKLGKDKTISVDTTALETRIRDKEEQERKKNEDITGFSVEFDSIFEDGDKVRSKQKSGTKADGIGNSNKNLSELMEPMDSIGNEGQYDDDEIIDY